jgi:hypothetical protein
MEIHMKKLILAIAFIFITPALLGSEKSSQEMAPQKKEAALVTGSSAWWQQYRNEQLIHHASFGEIDAMKNDREKGAHIDYVDLRAQGYERWTALSCAIFHGRYDAAKYLIKNNANLKITLKVADIFHGNQKTFNKISEFAKWRLDQVEDILCKYSTDNVTLESAARTKSCILQLLPHLEKYEKDIE